MEKYATDDKNERNLAYPSFGPNCANFVSQSLVAGGATPVIYEWFCTGDLNATEIEKLILKLGSAEHQILGHNVHYNDLDEEHDVLLSDTWNYANSQYHYFTNPKNGYANGKVLEAGSVQDINNILKNYNIQTGDLVYWSEKGDGFANHAIIISKVDENYIYYAGNTEKRFDEKIVDEKFQRYSCVYIVRLKDEVFENESPE